MVKCTRINNYWRVALAPYIPTNLVHLFIFTILFLQASGTKIKYQTLDCRFSYNTEMEPPEVETSLIIAIQNNSYL
jgi:hypothetical protein